MCFKLEEKRETERENKHKFRCTCSRRAEKDIIGTFLSWLIQALLPSLASESWDAVAHRHNGSLSRDWATD